MSCTFPAPDSFFRWLNTEKFCHIHILRNIRFPFSIISYIIRRYHYTTFSAFCKYIIQKKLCNEFNVGYGVHYINGIQCKEVLFDDIKKIEEDSKYKTTCLKANFMELSFGKRFVNVYKNDEKEKFYIKNEQCEQYNIGRGHHYINSDLYKEVSKSIQRFYDNNLNNFSHHIWSIKYS